MDLPVAVCEFIRMVVGKALVGLAWVFGIGSVVSGAHSGIARAGRLTFWLLTVAHTVECVVFLPALRQSGGSLGLHLLQTFLFGMLHVRSLPAVGG